jgi:hypothetical protein
MLVFDLTRRNLMNALSHFLLLSTISLAPQLCLAQPPPQEKTKSEEHAQPTIPVKVQVVFSEYDGEKKISSMPYSFTAITNEKLGGYYSASLRTGVRIPVEAGAEQKTSYLDVGSNIDCGIRTTDDDRYHLYMIFERSALYPNSGAQTEKTQVSRPDAPPLVRQFKASVNMILKDGQTSETVSTDPLNGHSLRISATINVMK